MFVKRLTIYEGFVYCLYMVCCRAQIGPNKRRKEPSQTSHPLFLVFKEPASCRR